MQVVTYQKATLNITAHAHSRLNKVTEEVIKDSLEPAMASLKKQTMYTLACSYELGCTMY